MPALVEPFVVETDRECLLPVADAPRVFRTQKGVDQGGYRRGVDAARKAGPYRDVAPEPEPDGIGQEVPEPSGGFIVSDVSPGGVVHREIPVTLRDPASLPGDDERVRRRELENAVVHRLGGMVRNPPGEERRERPVVRLPAGCRMDTERLDLRGEEKRSPDEGVVERLDAQAVPGAEEFAAPRVPEGERPHPVEPG